MKGKGNTMGRVLFIIYFLLAIAAFAASLFTSEKEETEKMIRIDKIIIHREFDQLTDFDMMEDLTEDNPYLAEDRKRYEEWIAGKWCYMGIWAEAIVSYPSGKYGRRVERLASQGLWGIESTCPESFFSELEQEQLADLKLHLEQFCIDTTDFEQVPIERKDY